MTCGLGLKTVHLTVFQYGLLSILDPRVPTDFLGAVFTLENVFENIFLCFDVLGDYSPDTYGQSGGKNVCFQRKWIRVDGA